jgi:hypothetical protein
MLKVNSENLDQLFEKNQIVILSFTTKNTNDTLLEIEKQFPDLVCSGIVNPEENNDLYDYYNIRKVPTIIMFNEKNTLVYRKEIEPTLQELINKVMSL